MSTPPLFGSWLKRLRAHHDLTQERLAELVYCSVQTIRFFESGKRRPSIEMAERLADVLHVAGDQREHRRPTARGIAEPSPPPVAAPASAPPAAPPPAPLPQLPAPPTALIGRQAERAVLRQLLSETNRLVTIVGPGGVGKTRLALQVAHEMAERFAQGALFVPLAAVTRAADIPVAVAQALGVTPPGARDAAEQLLALLAGRSLLLLLDNIEQLLGPDQGDETTALLAHTLEYTETVSLLVTSRERLHVQGEHVFELTGLATPTPNMASDLLESDAVLLFLERARQVAGHVALTPANRPAIVQICALLDGAPLGIELAAAWARALTVEEIAAELASGIDFLTAQGRHALGRHGSLRAVFDHSWTLLSAPERTVLARLALFRGGFDRTAAQAVAGAGLPMLAAFIDKSLVQKASDGVDGGSGSPRYDIHEMLRQYLAEKLPEVCDEKAQRQQYAQYYVTWVEELAPRLYQPDAQTWLRRLEVDEGNLRAVLAWSLSEGHAPALGLQLAGALGRFWYLTGRWKEGRTWLQQAHGKPAGDEPQRARALVALGELYYLLGEQKPARVCLEEGVERWRALGDAASIAWALFQLGNLLLMDSENEKAKASFLESVATYRALDNEWGVATVLNQLGAAAITQGDYQQAVEWLNESLPLIRSLQRPGGIATSLNLLGRALLGEGETARALAHFEEALSLLTQRQSKAGVAWSLINLGLGYIQADQPVEAGDYFRRALAIYQELGSISGLIAALEGLAAADMAKGAAERAVMLLSGAERLRKETGHALTRYEEEMSQRTRALSEAALDVDTWAEAWRRGSQSPLDALLEQAQ